MCLILSKFYLDKIWIKVDPNSKMPVTPKRWLLGPPVFQVEFCDMYVYNIIAPQCPQYGKSE